MTTGDIGCRMRRDESKTYKFKYDSTFLGSIDLNIEKNSASCYALNDVSMVLRLDNDIIGIRPGFSEAIAV